MKVKINGKTEEFRRRTIGLALSGGGLRGAAHIGVLKILEENNIPVHMIAGTSAGAIAAAMYACGYTPIAMQQNFETLNLNELVDLKISVADLFKHGLKWLVSGKFRFWSVLPNGLIKGDKIEHYFAKLWQNRTVRNTQIPLAVTAVDIQSGDTVFFSTPIAGKRDILNARYYHNAQITEAVRASISIPGVFFPKKYRGMMLVDGAVKNNLPTDILHHMGADLIIAVDLGYSGQPNYSIKTVSDILIQCIDIMGREVTLHKAEQYAHVIIRPPVGEISFTNSKQMSQCIAIAEQATREKIAEIQAVINSS